MHNKTVKSFTFSATIIAIFSLPHSAFAQSPGQMPGHPMPYSSMHQQGGMMPSMPKGQEMSLPVMPGSQSFPDFPTPDQLANMIPPEPMTVEKIKSRFAKRKSLLSESMDRDRKSAEKYARDFAKYQKHQAETLAEIMSQAEKRRQQMLQQLELDEQHALSQFEQFQQHAENTPPVEEAEKLEKALSK